MEKVLLKFEKIDRINVEVINAKEEKLKKALRLARYSAAHQANKIKDEEADINRTKRKKRTKRLTNAEKALKEYNMVSSMLAGELEVLQSKILKIDSHVLSTNECEKSERSHPERHQYRTMPDRTGDYSFKMDTQYNRSEEYSFGELRFVFCEERQVEQLFEGNKWPYMVPDARQLKESLRIAPIRSFVEMWAKGKKMFCEVQVAKTLGKNGLIVVGDYGYTMVFLKNGDRLYSGRNNEEFSFDGFNNGHPMFFTSEEHGQWDYKVGGTWFNLIL